MELPRRIYARKRYLKFIPRNTRLMNIMVEWIENGVNKILSRVFVIHNRCKQSRQSRIKYCFDFVRFNKKDTLVFGLYSSSRATAIIWARWATKTLARITTIGDSQVKKGHQNPQVANFNWISANTLICLSSFVLTCLFTTQKRSSRTLLVSSSLFRKLCRRGFCEPSCHFVLFQVYSSAFNSFNAVKCFQILNR
jgi:hypothetical protein